MCGLRQCCLSPSSKDDDGSDARSYYIAAPKRHLCLSIPNFPILPEIFKAVNVASELAALFLLPIRFNDFGEVKDESSEGSRLPTSLEAQNLRSRSLEHRASYSKIQQQDQDPVGRL